MAGLSHPASPGENGATTYEKHYKATIRAAAQRIKSCIRDLDVLVVDDLSLTDERCEPVWLNAGAVHVTIIMRDGGSTAELDFHRWLLP